MVRAWSPFSTGQLCIKQCCFHMTGCQKQRAAVYVREGDPNGPRAATHTGSPKLLISSLPDSLRSSHHPPGARSAPHHCRQYVTFSAMRGEKENKRKGRRGEREEDQGKEEESKGGGERERKTSFSSDALKK